MMKCWMFLLAVALLLCAAALEQDGGADGGEEAMTASWVLTTGHAAFSPRDTAEDCVFDGKMWISNGYYHGDVLTRDLWNTTDGATWTLVSEGTAYDGYAELTVYDGKMWAIKGSVWNPRDGVNWTSVLEKTPFGTRDYGELVVFQDKMWQLGSSNDASNNSDADVWNSSDGVNWTRVTADAGYESRFASAVAVYKDKLWVMGGGVRKPNIPEESGYKYLTTYNDVWCSADGVTWERVLEHAPWPPRMWFVAAVYAGKMWILGGYDNVHSANLGDTWYTEDGVTWHEFVSDPTFTGRHEPTVYVYSGSLWLVAGNTWPVVNDVWRLTLPQSQGRSF